MQSIVDDNGLPSYVRDPDPTRVSDRPDRGDRVEATTVRMSTVVDALIHPSVTEQLSRCTFVSTHLRRPSFARSAISSSPRALTPGAAHLRPPHRQSPQKLSW